MAIRVEMVAAPQLPVLFVYADDDIVWRDVLVD